MLIICYLQLLSIGHNCVAVRRWMATQHKHAASSTEQHVVSIYTVFQKKTSTHIIGYKLRNSCPILIIFDIKIPHII